MKAVQMERTGSFEVLRCVEMEPPSPGPGQVLVKVASVSVNYADVMLRKGTYPFMPPLPAVPGLECSGTVEALGEGVSGLGPGQPVIAFGPGAYAEYVLAEAAAVTPIPEEVDFDEAAALTVNYATAYHLLHTMAGLCPGQTVLLYAAAGGVGTAAIQLARLAGLKIIGLTGSEEKARYARELGADHVINHRTEDVLGRIEKITEGRGVSAILNSVAGESLARDFEALAHFGQIIWFGLAAGPPKVDLLEKLAAGFGKSLGIRTFALFSVPLADPAWMAQTLDKLTGYLRAGKIRPHIHRRFPLCEAAKAHELLESRTVTGKLILKP